MIRKIALLLWIGLSVNAQNHDCYELPAASLEDIKNDVFYLASKELAGRLPGTSGDKLSRQHILAVFKTAGLEPAMRGGFEQEFSVPNRVLRLEGLNTLRYKKKALKIDEDFYPVAYSSSGVVSGKTEYVSFGIESKELKRDDIDDKDVLGNIAVLEISSPDGIHPHSKYKQWHDISKRVKLLKEKGASAVILVKTKGNANSPAAEFKSLESCGLPVIFIRNAKIAKKLRRSRSLTMEVRLKEFRDITYNLAGIINNGAPQTIIIGAHYDHLGFGGENSRYRGDQEEQIHNGADDNASGVAGLLSLARYLARTEDVALRSFNYLVVAFSAEEMGLLGSKYFTQQIKKITNQSFSYMMNMDMIGRMEDGNLAINGVGTSPLWQDIINPINCELSLKFSESGVGPSDHTSFYYLNMPVLHFFTGTHADYHMPTDDAEKINIKGIFKTVNLMLSIIRNSPFGDALPFSPTKTESTKAPKFSVTLGLMPDYLFSGQGMRIDGVTKGKPGEGAGLQAGDIITQLGEVQVSSMQTYMEALSKLKKGESTTMLFKRGAEVLSANVQF
jgi:aminopeptidase YwaD